MPKNKDALIRYRVINRCFTERGNVTLQELVEACEKALDIAPISERTIEADINAMRYDRGLGYNAPIRRDRIKKVYYYENPDYSIDNIPLNEDELESLVFAARLLDQYKNIEIFKTFTGSVQKLVDALSIYRLVDKDTIRDFIEFEGTEATKGTEYLELLIDALKNRLVLRIEYKSFTSNRSTTHIIHPYHLKEFRNRWFLIGFNDKYSGIRTYGLDRMVDIKVEENIRFIDKGFDAKKYYENVIGVSVLDKKPVEIHLAFSELQSQYVITQPLHKSQEFLKKDGNRFIFKYFLVPNYELYSQILGWGTEVIVVKPAKVKNRISELIRMLADSYVSNGI